MNLQKHENTVVTGLLKQNTHQNAPFIALKSWCLLYLLIFVFERSRKRLLGYFVNYGYRKWHNIKKKKKKNLVMLVTVITNRQSLRLME